MGREMPVIQEFIAITGKLIPDMEKEITPHREAVLSAKRTVVNNPNRNTPKACEASTSNRPANSMGSIPLLQG